MGRAGFLLLLLAALAASSPSSAPAAQFDLQGPRLSVTVSEGGAELPIAQTPNLRPGDHIRIRPEFPADQSAHYLLVTAFLRGATNPPPKSWFHSIETWTPKGKAGLELVVPAGAGELLLFLAPQTGGDYSTLIGAVRGRPGAFVRASQALNLARLNRSRYETFLRALRSVDLSAPEKLKTESAMLARSLDIKLDSDCFKKSPEEQADCLLQGEDSIVLTDGHSSSLVDALTSESSSGLVAQLTASPRSGMKYYGPYVGSLFDVVHILESFRTAQYQYIPALLSESGNEALLLLNTTPSFYDPKSVLVAALPEIEPDQPPPLRAVDPASTYCASSPSAVLPAEGAPLIFSTEYARGLSLSVKDSAGADVEIPVRASAEAGGLVLNGGRLDGDFDPTVEAKLHGYWGFSPFEGPTFRLDTGAARAWTVLEPTQSMSLIAGRTAAVQLHAAATACLDTVEVATSGAAMKSAPWKQVSPGGVAVTLPLEGVKPGNFELVIHERGGGTPQRLKLTAYVPETDIRAITIHAGDATATITGDKLEEIARMDFHGVNYAPVEAQATDGGVGFIAQDPVAASKLTTGENGMAHIILHDGRSLTVPVVVATPTPRIDLIDESYNELEPKGRLRLILGASDVVPSGASLTFSFRVEAPDKLSPASAVEVSVEGEARSVRADISSGLFLEDAHVGVVTVDTGRAFANASAGPLKFRLVSGDGVSNWRSLGTLVRVPELYSLKCPKGVGGADRSASDPNSAGGTCVITGARLFMLAAVSDHEDFTHAVKVPPGYASGSLSIPAPTGKRLYVTLRDAATIINAVALAPGAGQEALTTKVQTQGSPLLKDGVETQAGLPASALASGEEPLRPPPKASSVSPAVTAPTPTLIPSAEPEPTAAKPVHS